MKNSEKFWDRLSSDYTDHEDHVNLYENKDFTTTLKYLKPDDTVLDYGCASGIIANAIADKVKEVHGIDISSKMIEIAKEKASSRQLNNVHYAQATIYDEKYGKDNFDVIIAFRILHMLENIHDVMNRINEIMKPDGVFISVTTCMGKNSVLSFLIRPLSKLGILPHINYFKLNDLQKVITDGGFEVLEYEKLGDRIATYCVVARKL